MERGRKREVLVKLFVSTLCLSTFISGRGYVIVILMKKKFANECHWIGEGKMLGLIAIVQSSPRAIIVNGAIVVGYKLVGMVGMLTTTIATILPLFVIISLLSVVYNLVRDNLTVSQMLKGIQAGVEVVIAAVIYEMGYRIVRGRNAVSTAIMAGAFIATCLFNVDVVYVAIACGLIGVVGTLLAGREGREV